MNLILKNSDWYGSLVEDCKAIICEHGFIARSEVIKAKWELGERLANDTEYVKHAKGEGFVRQVAVDLGVSEPAVYQSLKFYELFPEFDKVESLPEAKSLTWHKIVQEHLGVKNDKPVRNSRTLKEVYGALETYFRAKGLSETDIIAEIAVIADLLAK